MKYFRKIALSLLVLYSLIIQLFKTVFEFLNKSKYSDYWLSVLRNDLPNMITTFVLVYVLTKILMSFNKEQ
jgi:hypothetical protein